MWTMPRSGPEARALIQRLVRGLPHSLTIRDVDLHRVGAGLNLSWASEPYDVEVTAGHIVRVVTRLGPTGYLSTMPHHLQALQGNTMTLLGAHESELWRSLMLDPEGRRVARSCHLLSLLGTLARLYEVRVRPQWLEDVREQARVVLCLVAVDELEGPAREVADGLLDAWKGGPEELLAAVAALLIP